MKVVVLDLDETLGAFTAFAQHLRSFNTIFVTPELFEQTLDLHPEFLRPGILELLTFISKMRILNRCAVVLYTNNNNEGWVNMIVDYVARKVNDTDLFSAVVHGKHPKRNPALVKSVRDLKSCVRLPKDATICFVDDQRHTEMMDPMVELYVQPKPYAIPGAASLSDTKRLYECVSQFLQNSI